MGKYLLYTMAIFSVAAAISQIAFDMVFPFWMVLVFSLVFFTIAFMIDQHPVLLYVAGWFIVMTQTGDSEAPAHFWHWLAGFVSSFGRVKY